MAGIGEIAAKAGVPYEQASKTIKGLVACITELNKGEKITLQGLGTFELVDHSARVGRNPANGEEVQVPAKTVPKLNVNRELKAKVNERVNAPKKAKTTKPAVEKADAKSGKKTKK